MRILFYVLALCLATLPAYGESSWLDMFSAELREVKHQLRTAQDRLDALEKLTPAQTVQELGYMHEDKTPAETISHWVQVDLQQSHVIEQIALVPVQNDWSPLGAPYGFPKRFRVDISDDPEFLTCLPVGIFTDADFEDPGIAPVVLNTNSKSGRYVRVTVMSPRGFVLAELMVISANRNVALGCPILATHSAIAAPRWNTVNLVDGRTPLGPPVAIDDMTHEGLYAGPSPDGSSAYMGFDLKAEIPIDEVRLYPIHTRGGTRIAGHGFPSEFRVEVSREPHFGEPTVLPLLGMTSRHPGDNSVSAAGGGRKARYVRIVIVKEGALIRDGRFGLAEMEVYSGGVNVARGADVMVSMDPTPTDTYSTSVLNDGFTNFGRILSLPSWLENWRQRRELLSELKRLDFRKTVFTAQAAKRAQVFVIGIVALLIGAGSAFLWKTNRARKREMEKFRRQIANDLHDEIGSNLAAIEMMSETSAKHTQMAVEYSPKINRIARETTRAMRETLWLAGFREEAENDFMEQLQLTAARILAGREFEWVSVTTSPPLRWTPEKQRQIFLFFKEALTNAVRHSKATLVQLSAEVKGDEFKLMIKDNGLGFSINSQRRGVGMQSLKERAASSGGVLNIETSPGSGTTITLRASLAA